MRMKPPEGIYPSEDPLLNIEEPNELIDGKIEEFAGQFGQKLDDLIQEGVIDIDGISDLLIFGPGLSDTTAVFKAIEERKNSDSDIHIDVVEGDIRVASEIGYRQSIDQLPQDITFWEDNFHEFLVGPHPDFEEVGADLVVISNTGPATTVPNVGFSPETMPILAERTNNGGLVVTCGETHKLDDYLEYSPDFERVETDKRKPLRGRGFTVWKKR